MMDTVYFVLAALVGGYVFAAFQVDTPKTTQVNIFLTPWVLFEALANYSNNRSYPVAAVGKVLLYSSLEALQAAAIVFGLDCLSKAVPSAHLMHQGLAGKVLFFFYLFVAWLVSNAGGLLVVDKMRESANDAIRDIDVHFSYQNRMWVEDFISQQQEFQEVLAELQDSAGMTRRQALSMYVEPRGQGPLTNKLARDLMQRFERKSVALSRWDDLNKSYDKFQRPR